MAFDLFAEVNTKLENSSDDQSLGMPDIPKEVRTFLGQLAVLQHIPIYYLIPDQGYLHIEDGNDGGVLKLFRLDKEWIECLMDGSLSIGPDDDRKLLLDKAMAGNYTAEVFYDETKELIKQQIKGLYQPDDYVEEFDRRIADKQITFLEVESPEENNKQPAPTTAQNNWCYTGFLMRSSIISAWAGVEVIAMGDDPNDPQDENDPVILNRPLKVVRMERIADDTLFCICEGIVREVEIIQPTEAFHFGLVEDNGIYSVNGTTVELRTDAAPGVVDISKLQTDLPAVDDSANFAKTMAAKPLKVYMKIAWTKEN